MKFEEIKEIADRYGIKVCKVKKGQGGFVVDESGEVKKKLPRHLIDGFLGIDNSGFIGVNTLLNKPTCYSALKYDPLAA